MLQAPVPLSDTHILDDFDCGVVSLNDWLKRRAAANQKNNASRTYVVTNEQKVIAYYCLSSGALALIDTPSPIKRNMPDPVPVVIQRKTWSRYRMERPRLGYSITTRCCASYHASSGNSGDSWNSSTRHIRRSQAILSVLWVFSFTYARYDTYPLPQKAIN
ncbi:hypothetical protein NIES4071_94380 [Calothrix sp. NIES-4071]|nr:hypothetical protein NIES4071_94380 [Calothrix sp. NIES-4071]BAZ63703.1 hypothetical protein NIES4105_94310 [Calothrix sp. NIES-4105]